jgi:hypothetical protein
MSGLSVISLMSFFGGSYRRTRRGRFIGVVHLKPLQYLPTPFSLVIVHLVDVAMYWGRLAPFWGRR